jgi:hypothetical protein
MNGERTPYCCRLGHFVTDKGATEYLGAIVLAEPGLWYVVLVWLALYLLRLRGSQYIVAISESRCVTWRFVLDITAFTYDAVTADKYPRFLHVIGVYALANYPAVSKVIVANYGSAALLGVKTIDNRNFRYEQWNCIFLGHSANKRPDAFFGNTPGFVVTLC